MIGQAKSSTFDTPSRREPRSRHRQFPQGLKRDHRRAHMSGPRTSWSPRAPRTQVRRCGAMFSARALATTPTLRTLLPSEASASATRSGPEAPSERGGRAASTPCLVLSSQRVRSRQHAPRECRLLPRTRRVATRHRLLMRARDDTHPPSSPPSRTFRERHALRSGGAARAAWVRLRRHGVLRHVLDVIAMTRRLGTTVASVPRAPRAQRSLANLNDASVR